LLSEVLGSTEVKRRHCFDVEKYLVGDQQNKQTVGKYNEITKTVS
jgi:hypothetical protein